MASPLVACGIATSEALVKALKGGGGDDASMLRLLVAADADGSVYVPKKEELLLDSALDALLRGAKARAPHGDEPPAYLMPAYWDVLRQLLSRVAQGGEHSALHGPVGKFNILQLCAQLCARADAGVWTHAVPALHMLLPAAIRRTAAAHIDAVNACFVDLFRALPMLCEGPDLAATARLLAAMVARWLPALELGSNAKKTAKFFLGAGLLPYAAARAAVASRAERDVSGASDVCALLDDFASASLYASLRTQAPGGALPPPEMMDALARVLADELPAHPTDLLAAMPALLAQLVRGDGRGGLWPTDVAQRGDRGLPSDARTAAPPPTRRAALPAPVRAHVLEHFLVPLLRAARALHETYNLVPFWRRMAEQMDFLALYQRGGDDQDAWASLWTTMCDDTLLSLAHRPDAAEDAFATLQVLWRVDSAHMEAHLRPILAATARFDITAAPRCCEAARAAALALVRAIVEGMGAAREVPKLVACVADALDKSAAQAVAEDAAQAATEAAVQAALVRSPLLDTTASAHWEHVLADYVTPLQVAPLVQHVATRASAQLGRTEHAPAYATMQLLLVVVRGLRSVPRDVLHDCRAVAAGFMDAGVAACTERGPPARELLLAAGLRVDYMLCRRLDSPRSHEERPPAFARARAMLGEISAPENQLELPFVDALHSGVSSALHMDAHPGFWDGQIAGVRSAACVPVALWRLVTTRWMQTVDATLPEEALSGLAATMHGFLAARAESNTVAGMLHLLSCDALCDARFLEMKRWRAALIAVLADATAWLDTATDVDPAKLSASLALASRMPVAYLPRDTASVLRDRLLAADSAWVAAGMLTRANLGAWALLHRVLTRLWPCASAPTKLPLSLPEYAASLARVRSGGAWRPERDPEHGAERNPERDPEDHPEKRARGRERGNKRRRGQDVARAASCEGNPLAIAARCGAAAEQATRETEFIEGAAHLLRAMLRGAHSATRAAALARLPRESSADDTFSRLLKIHLRVAALEETANEDHGRGAEENAASSPSRNAVSACAMLRPLLRGTADAAYLDLLPLRLGAYAAEMPRCHGVSTDDAHALLGAVRCVCLASGASGEAFLRAARTVPPLFSCIVAARGMDSGDAYVAPTLAYATLRTAFRESRSLETRFVGCLADMDAGAYSMTLEAVGNASGSAVTAGLLDALTLLLCHAPPNSSRTASRHLSAWLVRLPALVVADRALVAPTAALMDRVCNARPLILRDMDVPRILALHAALLQPRGAAPASDGLTGDDIFRSLVGALSALVRLRKDLVMKYLPHMTGSLLALLPLLVSFLQQNTGRAARRQVAAAMPDWLDVASAPLGVGAARAFGRLLTELPGKTTSAAVPAKRHRTVDVRHVTAESVARALSKHAVYILVAYARCATQPATTIAQPLRKELQAGLFALCSVVGEYERDAALKGMLDASAQLVFKTLWSEWERQRYRGT
ncbi:hypothetical protein MSPP1_001382 [Malassezia sp. CBS 17886]|nr:hypothetical protein MSPP1_001382 [Malassezia sp. CBS 17886]